MDCEMNQFEPITCYRFLVNLQEINSFEFTLAELPNFHCTLGWSDLKLEGFVTPANLDSLTQIPRTPMFVTVKFLSSGGKVVSSIKFENYSVRDISFDKMSYEKLGFLKFKLSLKPKNPWDQPYHT